jgi:hypothetical protein
VSKRSEGFPLDPRAFNLHGIDSFRMYRLERHSRMLHLADWFSGRLNNKEGIDLPYLHNNHNHLAHGQIFNKSNREVALITVSIAGVWIISSEIVRGPENLIKGRVPIMVSRIRARGR